MSSTVTVDTSILRQRLASLRTNEIPTAMRNVINDLMRDVVAREREEIKRVFDRPTPYIAKSPAVKRLATKQRISGEIWLRGEHNVLKPHIPGFRPRRDVKGIEDALRSRGALGSGEWLVPTRTAPLDQYGNVSRAVVRRMISDVSGRSPSSTYIWGEVQTRARGRVAGVWRRSAWQAHRPGALVLLAVGSEPHYRKRFDWYGVAHRHAARRAKHHANLAIAHAIRRRNT